MSEAINPSITSIMSNSGSLSNTKNLLMFTSYATQKLRAAIGWNRFDFPCNRVEMGGWLIGNYICDDSGEVVQAEVTDILVATNCAGTPTYLEWPAIEDIRLQREFFRMKDELTLKNPTLGERLSRIGWWHTHPNGLPVFMSSTDMETQRIKFFKAHDYSVVLNPHRMIWKAFVGRNADEVPAIMLLDKYIHVKERKHKKAKKSWKKKKMCTQKRQSKKNKKGRK